jgi:hypothetical protein
MVSSTWVPTDKYPMIHHNCRSTLTLPNSPSPKQVKVPSPSHSRFYTDQFLRNTDLQAHLTHQALRPSILSNTHNLPITHPSRWSNAIAAGYAGPRTILRTCSRRQSLAHGYPGASNHRQNRPDDIRNSSRIGGEPTATLPLSLDPRMPNYAPGNKETPPAHLPRRGSLIPQPQQAGITRPDQIPSQ